MILKCQWCKNVALYWEIKKKRKGSKDIGCKLLPLPKGLLCKNISIVCNDILGRDLKPKQQQQTLKH